MTPLTDENEGENCWKIHIRQCPIREKLKIIILMQIGGVDEALEIYWISEMSRVG
jgi:hypothetical protein